MCSYEPKDYKVSGADVCGAWVIAIVCAAITFLLLAL